VAECGGLLNRYDLLIQASSVQIGFSPPILCRRGRDEMHLPFKEQLRWVVPNRLHHFMYVWQRSDAPLS
jgi:hypothetical protein